MLPKITYRKLLKRLEQIRADWLKDAETANIPYCVRPTLHSSIDYLITQDKISTMGHSGRSALIEQTIAHLVTKNLVSCPVTGSGILYPIGSTEQFRVKS